MSAEETMSFATMDSSPSLFSTAKLLALKPSFQV